MKNSFSPYRTEDCSRCLALWRLDSEANTPIRKSPLIIYPHPECGKHSSIQSDTATIPKPGFFSPIKAIWWMRVPSNAPAIAIALSNPPRILPSGSQLVGYGVDYDPNIAGLKAIMEAIERFAAYMPPRTRLIWATPEVLTGRIPAALRAPIGIDRWWCETTRATDSKVCVLPLEYAQLQSVCTVSDPLVRADSTGLAVHIRKDQALAAGLAEALERYGLAKLWSGPVAAILDPKSFPKRAIPLAQVLYNLGYSIYAVPYCEDFAVCAVLLHRRSDAGSGPSLVGGAGCDWSLTGALSRALTEAYGKLMHALDIWPQNAEPGLPRLYDHFLYYHESQAADKLLNIWEINQAPVYPFHEKEVEESHMAYLPERINAEVLEIDRGNDLTDFLGLSAVQVVVPSHPPLNTHTYFRGVPTPFV